LNTHKDASKELLPDVKLEETHDIEEEQVCKTRDIHLSGFP
jgi:hypothetical protein